MFPWPPPHNCPDLPNNSPTLSLKQTKNYIPFNCGLIGALRFTRKLQLGCLLRIYVDGGRGFCATMRYHLICREPVEGIAMPDIRGLHQRFLRLLRVVLFIRVDSRQHLNFVLLKGSETKCILLVGKWRLFHLPFYTWNYSLPAQSSSFPSLRFPWLSSSCGNSARTLASAKT